MDTSALHTQSEQKFPGPEWAITKALLVERCSPRHAESSQAGRSLPRIYLEDEPELVESPSEKYLEEYSSRSLKILLELFAEITASTCNSILVTTF